MNASGRPNTCKSRGSNVTGARVRNTFEIYLEQGDSPPKGGLIPHMPMTGHPVVGKGAIRFEMIMRLIS